MRSTRHRHDGSTRENVTDGQARRAGGAVRGRARPLAGGGLPHARVARRGRGRGPGGLAPARPRGQREHRQPGGLADDGGRARVPRHAALAQVARRAAARRSGAGRGHAPDPEQEALLADSVGLALLVVLDTLEPAERLAFVLHDLFDLSFDEIAPIVGRSTAAARQLASRARRRVRGAAAAPDIARQREVVGAFLAAARGGDFEALVSVLDPEVVFRPDPAALRGGPSAEVRGAQAVAKLFSGRAQAARAALVNGAVGVVVAPRGRLFLALGLKISGGKISEVEVIADPARLRRLDLAVLDG